MHVSRHISALVDAVAGALDPADSGALIDCYTIGLHNHLDRRLCPRCISMLDRQRLSKEAVRYSCEICGLELDRFEPSCLHRAKLGLLKLLR